MVRVHGGRRAASVGAGAARHKQAQQGDQKKPSYKVVLEEISEQKKLKTFLSFNAEAPPGFTFIPAGDPQLTNRCKQLARDDGSTVYIVSMSDPKNPELSHEVHRVGYHFSSRVVENACLSLGVTLTESGRVLQSSFATLNEEYPTRHGKKVKSKGKGKSRASPPKFDLSQSQATIDTQAREAIRDLFPKIPEADLHETVARSFQKGRDLVGTSSDLSLARRAHLAVLAHIRHTHTNYDHLLKLVPWAEARKRVEGPTLDVLISWRDDVDDDTNAMRDVLREVIIISDNEEDDDDDIAKVRPSPIRNQDHRERSVEIISASNKVHTQQLDLAMEPPDSENEQPIQYIPRQNPPNYRRPHNRLREERQGAHRHQRWEQALSRKRNDHVPSTPHPRTAQTVPEPVYRKPIPNDSVRQLREPQRPPPGPFFPTYEDQRLLQSDASQHYLPSQRAKYLPSCTMEPSRIGPVSLTNPKNQVEYSSQQHRKITGLNSQYQHIPYRSPDPQRDHSYRETREAQQAPLLIPADRTRLVQFSEPPKGREVQYITTNEPLHRRRQSEMIIPSVEVDNFDTRDSAHVTQEEVSRYRDIALLEDVPHERLQYAPRSTVASRQHNEHPKLKRPREEDDVHVVGERPRLPPTYNDRDRAVVMSAGGHTPVRVIRQRAMEPLYDVEPQVMEYDSRIVQLPTRASRAPERILDSHRQAQPGFRPRHDKDGRPFDLSQGQENALPHEIGRAPYAQPSQHISALESHRTVDASLSYVHSPKVAPAYQPPISRVIRLETANDGSFSMPADEFSKNVQYYDEQGRALRNGAIPRREAIIYASSDRAIG